MYSFEILDLVLFVGLSQGIFLAIARQIVSEKNKAANRVLSLILLLAAFMLFGRIVYFRFTNELLEQIAFSADTVIFLFGPLIYLYVRRLTFLEPKKYRLSMYHYIPAILFMIFLAWTFSYSKEAYQQVLKENHIDLMVVYRLISMSAISSNFYYLFKSFKVIRTYQYQESHHVSFNQNVVSFLTTFLATILIIIFLWLASLVTRIFGVNVPFVNYDSVWTALSFFVYLVGYYSLIQPEIFKVKLETKFQKEIYKRVDDQKLQKLKEELKWLMLNEKVYLDSKLTLGDLAEKLNTSPNNVSWLLNKVYDCNFYEYVNRFRIKEFVKKVENGSHKEYTLLALSFDSGFNSKSTFNRAFKAEMNDTPTNYIKNLD